jgi:hypothetical protein
MADDKRDSHHHDGRGDAAQDDADKSQPCTIRHLLKPCVLPADKAQEGQKVQSNRKLSVRLVTMAAVASNNSCEALKSSNGCPATRYSIA